MKKCPVCGVEHSDIVHVCSICGSSLDDAPIVESTVKEEDSHGSKSLQTESVEQVKNDFSAEDIQKTISSIVSATVGNKQAEPIAEEVPFEEDSPFVINAMKDQKGDASSKNPFPAAAAPGKNGKHSSKRKKQNKNRAQNVDTTAVAAISAQKVYEATQNAINARNAQNAVSEANQAKPEGKAKPEPNKNDVQWSERKHTRDKSKASRQVIMAACALLALLIIALLILFGKMISGDGSGKPADNKAVVSEEQNQTDETQTPENAPDAENTDILPESEAEAQAQEAADNAQQETEQEVIDPDLDASGAETEAQPTESEEAPSQPETEQQPESRPAELPAITDANDTVYATADVNVRDYPGTQGSNVINVLSSGQSVKRTGTTENGWSRVEIDGKVGYVSNSYLSTTKKETNSGNESDSKSAVAKTGVNIRETPNGNVIGVLTEGQKVTLTGKTQGNWVQIDAAGVTGYVYQSYLSGSESKKSTNDNTKIKETGDTVYATSGVNVRNSPSSSGSTVLTTLTKGQKVTRVGTTSNGWSKITVGDVTGYVYSDYLSTTKDSSDKSSDNSGSSKSRSGYILPDASSKVYSKSELSKLSVSELRLARNEIYARHGRKFNDASLQKYFDSCSWYNGTVDPATFDANVSDYLNDNEIANLSAIASAEN